MEKIEFLILRNLLYNDNYTRKVLPFIKDEYFQDTNQRIIYNEISKFVQEYNDLPTKEILCIELEKRTDLNEESYKKTLGIISSLDNVPVDNKWLIDTTEKWCRDRAIYLALMESIHIADGNSDSKNRDAIPSILSDALAVSFDNHIGHDYFEDYEERFESYRRAEEKLPFDIEYLNKITNGGLAKKTLTIFMGSTGSGKTRCLCHLAASYLLQNKNVLYITLEMSEDKIAERIDANLLDVDIKSLAELPKKIFDTKVNNLMRKTQGALIVKEYPTASAHCGHFKALLNELNLKKSFVPDVIIVDYMNICSSSRYKSNTTINSYSYVKSIAEELRGLAVESNVPLITATQTNRCLGLDTIVTKEGGIDIEIKDVRVGDRILSHSGYVNVEYVYPIDVQDTYEITTKSGKKVVCSSRHIFPTLEGEKSIDSGLVVGDKLFVRRKNAS